MLERLKFWQNNNTCDSMKKKLTLSVDSNLIALARSKGVNLSQLMEQILLSNNQNHIASRGLHDWPLHYGSKKILIHQRQPEEYVSFVHSPGYHPQESG